MNRIHDADISRINGKIYLFIIVIISQLYHQKQKNTSHLLKEQHLCLLKIKQKGDTYNTIATSKH